MAPRGWRAFVRRSSPAHPVSDNSEVRRLLFLSYPFPPNQASGAVRAWNLARHLARRGWKITVVTVSPDGFASRAAADEVAEKCRREGIERVYAGTALFRPNQRFRTAPRRWLGYALKAAALRPLRPLWISHDEIWSLACVRRCRVFRKGDFDLVLATGCPYGTFLAARHIARRLVIPYVLDYRDPWTLSPFEKRFLGPFASRAESRVLDGASATVIVSHRWAEDQAEGFGMARPPVVIGNGFDPEDLAAVQPREFPEFALVYAGTFYEGQRAIDPVLKGVKSAAELLGERGRPIRLHVFGPDREHVLRTAARLGAQDLVVAHGRVPRSEALSAIRGAGAVAVIASIHDHASPAELGIVTGKIFEPLGMGVPVLLVAPEGSEATGVVEGVRAGKSFKPSQVQEMGRWLAELASGRIAVAYEPPAEFSWPVLAGRYDALLRSCLGKGRHVFEPGGER